MKKNDEVIVEENGMIELVVDEVAVKVNQAPTQVVPLGELMEMATTLSKSTIVPVDYRNRPENVLIALDMANRMGISPFIVMQQMYLVQGKPSFSGQFVAMIVQNNPRFTDVEIVYVGEEDKDSYGAYVRAKDVKSGKELKGTVVTIGMSKKEGWYAKNGSKWQTMPTQMLGYRAYTYFGRLYAPAELMGMMASDEVEDVSRTTRKVDNPYGG